MISDLHIHSTYSDGELTPREILRRAAESGLEQISITDHGNLHAYDDFGPEDIPPGLRVVPGIEVDCDLIHMALGIHKIEILGYGFDPKAPELRETVDGILEQRRVRGRAVMQYLNQELGVTLWPEDLMRENATVLLPRVLRPYVRKGHLADLKEGRRLVAGAPGIPQVRKLAADRVIELIHAAGGKAVLAHPGLNRFGSDEMAGKALASLREDGLDGFEAYYDYERSEKRVPDFDTEGFGDDWTDALRTGGSDAHIGDDVGRNAIDAVPLPGAWVGA